MESVISLKNITKTFIFDGREPPKLIAIEDISLDIASGEFFVFVGPSGSGKSTLLRIISGLEKDYKGEINFGKGISHDDFSFVFQQFALLPWLTVFNNVELGLLDGISSYHERKETVLRELKQLGLEKFAHSYPRELSGGMRQRVGIARALATNPKIMLLDEPFSELDSFTAEELRKELLAIWQERKMTVVMVTHIIEEALELADRIAVLTSRPGKIEKIVTNNLSRPRQKRSPEFYTLEDEIYSLVKP